MPGVCLDWDDTLCGFLKHPRGEWIDNAPNVLHELRRQGLSVTIHTAKVQFPGGREEIVDKLGEIGLAPSGSLRIVEKPLALAYVDDRAVKFDGDWSDAMNKVLAARHEWKTLEALRRERKL